MDNYGRLWTMDGQTTLVVKSLSRLKKVHAFKSLCPPTCLYVPQWLRSSIREIIKGVLIHYKSNHIWMYVGLIWTHGGLP